MESLEARIAKKIADIPVSSGSYIACYQETLRNVIAPALIERIAQVAAEEAALARNIV